MLKHRILFISPYETLNNIGWQDIQLSTMKKYCVAYAYNNVIESGNIYNLNGSVNRIARIFKNNINERLLYPTKLSIIHRKYNYNIVVCNFLDFALRFKHFISKSHIPFLIFCHGRDIIWDYINPKTGKKQYGNDFFKSLNTIKDKAYFIANSSFTKSQLMKVGINPDRIYIKYFGLEPKENIKEVRQSGNLRLLFVGRLIACKGPIETIKAFILAKENGFKGTLTVVGSGTLEQECRQIVSHSNYSDQIFMVGSMPHPVVLEHLKEHDVIVAHQRKDPQTNQEEALGISLIEGLSYGLPVITCASGGVADIISCGYNGYLTPQNDIQTQSLKFLELENNVDLYNQMSRNAFETVRTKFSKDVDRRRILEILESIYSTNGNASY